MSGGHASEPACTPASAVFFIVALVAGTGCTIVSKAVFSFQSIGISGEMEFFRPPLFCTLTMFFGMSIGIPAHYLLTWNRHRKARTDPDERALLDAEPPVTLRTFLMLGVPSLFDLLATALTTIGLLSVNASVWQLLRGGAIVFVAVMKHYVLRDLLTRAQWLGVIIITVATCLVGVSSTMGGKNPEGETANLAPAGNPAMGVLFTLAGTFMQSLQYVYEERVMGGELQAPPWLLIGTEGVCGFLLCAFVLYPIAYVLPGDDAGSFENPWNTLSKLQHSPTICVMIALYTFLIFLLNALSVLITLMMSSVWHAILDNFRPLAVWVCQLCLFYVLTPGTLGEAWTFGSWLQLGGMAILLLGTAVYNGSVQLPGLETERLLTPRGDLKFRASPALVRSPLLPRGPELEQAFHDLPAGTPRQKKLDRELPVAASPPFGGPGNLRETLLRGTA